MIGEIVLVYFLIGFFFFWMVGLSTEDLSEAGPWFLFWPILLVFFSIKGMIKIMVGK